MNSLIDVFPILADVNVPEEYVSALRGDGYEVKYTRDIEELGPTAADDEIVAFAIDKEFGILTTDVTDFSDHDAPIPIFVAHQNMTGSEVRAAIARIDALPFDARQTSPLWLSAV